MKKLMRAAHVPYVYKADVKFQLTGAARTCGNMRRIVYNNL